MADWKHLIKGAALGFSDRMYKAYIEGMENSLLGFSKVERATSLAGPPGARVLKQIVRLSVPDAFARSWVVTLGDLGGKEIDATLQQFSSNVIGNTFVRLKWGRAGIFQQCDIDWRLGQQITLAGSYVEVTANIDSGAVAFTGFQEPRVNITEGQASQSLPHTRSIQVGQVLAEGAQSAILPIPRMARKVHHTVLFGADSRDLRRIQFFADESGLIPLGFYDYGTFTGPGFDGPVVNYPEPAWIPPFATHFQFTNNSDEIMNQVRIIFELML